MARTITRTGRQQASLAAGCRVVADLLADPVAVTDLLGDLLDQQRSRPTHWAIPRISLGPASFDTMLVPRFRREGDVVHIEAVATEASDADAHIELTMEPVPDGPGACHLRSTWHLVLRVPLPRAALRFVGPAVDRTVASTVQTIMRRTERAAVAREDDQA